MVFHSGRRYRGTEKSDRRGFGDGTEIQRSDRREIQRGCLHKADLTFACMSALSLIRSKLHWKVVIRNENRGLEI